MIRLLALLFALLLLCCTRAQAQEETKLIQGFDGGMMLHVGYLTGTIPAIHYPADGATFGIGGVIRMHLGQHWMIGTEGYVSTMSQLNNGSYIKHSWGGLLGEFYWPFKYVMPYCGVTIGGGAQTSLLMFDGDRGDWQQEEATIFHKQSFLAIDPFVGCDFIVSKVLHLTLKIDCLSSISNEGLQYPMGPRFYFGVIFYH